MKILWFGPVTVGDPRRPKFEGGLSMAMVEEIRRRQWVFTSVRVVGQWDLEH
jgi:hypothetical protein